MNKKLLSAVAALTIAASMSAMPASAMKVGDANADAVIDIEDAVSVINHINGVKPLLLDGPNRGLTANVDGNEAIDIEDAVRIINHINGVTPLPDEDKDTGEYWVTIYNDTKYKADIMESFSPNIYWYYQGQEKIDNGALKGPIQNGESFSFGIYSGNYTESRTISLKLGISELNKEYTIEFDPFKKADKNHRIEIHFDGKDQLAPKSAAKFWFNMDDYKAGREPDYIYDLYDKNDMGLPTKLSDNEYNNANFIPDMPSDLKYFGWLDMSKMEYAHGNITGDIELVACNVKPTVFVSFFNTYADFKENKVNQNVTLYEDNDIGLPTKLTYDEYSKFTPKAPNEAFTFDHWVTKFGDEFKDDITNVPDGSNLYQLVASYNVDPDYRPELKEGEYWVTLYNDSDSDITVHGVSNGPTGFLFDSQRFESKTSNRTDVIAIPAGKHASFGYRDKNNTYAAGGNITVYDTKDIDLSTGYYLENTLFNIDPFEKADENHNIKLNYAPSAESKPGVRTVNLFKDITDGNYRFKFSGTATVIGIDTGIEATIRQISKEQSRIHVKMDAKNIDSDIVIDGKKKFKIIDEANKKYSANLSATERMLDFNGIFSSIASNKDTLKFTKQEIRSDTITEYYNATITTPVTANVIIEAVYNKKNLTSK